MEVVVMDGLPKYLTLHERFSLLLVHLKYVGVAGSLCVCCCGVDVVVEAVLVKRWLLDTNWTGVSETYAIVVAVARSGIGCGESGRLSS